MNEASGSNYRAADDKGPSRALSPALPCLFTLVDSPADFRDPGSIVVRVPHGVRSKQKLFAIFANALRFPRYFGWNWDAFEECLGDLSWLPAERPIAIVHEDLPFGPGGDNRAIYLNVLQDTAMNWVKAGQRKLQIVMPASLETSLSSAANMPR